MAATAQAKKPANLGLLALLFLAGLIIYLVHRGGQVQEVGMPFGGSVKFSPSIAGPEKAEETSTSELKARQSELEEKMRRLDSQLSARDTSPGLGGSGPGPSILGTPALETNLAGNWQGAQGFYGFAINQSGPALAFQWFEPVRGLIAVGQGQVQGQQVNLSYSTALGTQGVAQLYASPDGHTLSGGFRDLTTGYQGQLYLTR